MFKKNKKVETTKNFVYTDWEKDFGFLNLIMDRKQNITINFLIKVRNKQLKNKDYLRDEDIEPLIDEGVKDTLEQIGENYKKYIIDKYFGTEKALISYITEDWYVTLVGATINENNTKIKVNSQKDAIEIVNRLNSADAPKKKK